MFLHVDDSAGQSDPLHPFQGELPVLKFVVQPSTQLPVTRASLASFAASESGAADAAGTVGDVRRDTAWATALRVGRGRLATWVGAWTVTLGSVAVGVVCDIAAPPKPHKGGAIDTVATARHVAQSDESFIAVPSRM